LISDILRSRKGLILYSCVIAFVSVIMMFHITVDFIFLPLAPLGIAGGMMPVGIFTAVTELFREPEKAGGCMAAVVFGQYLGMFIGPVLFSSIADGIGWLTASYFLASIAVIAFLSSMRLKME
jgi:MFS family permease